MIPHSNCPPGIIKPDNFPPGVVPPSMFHHVCFLLYFSSCIFPQGMFPTGIIVPDMILYVFTCYFPSGIFLPGILSPGNFPVAMIPLGTFPSADAYDLDV